MSHLFAAVNNANETTTEKEASMPYFKKEAKVVLKKGAAKRMSKQSKINAVKMGLRNIAVSITAQLGRIAPKMTKIVEVDDWNQEYLCEYNHSDVQEWKRFEGKGFAKKAPGKVGDVFSMKKLDSGQWVKVFHDSLIKKETVTITKFLLTPKIYICADGANVWSEPSFIDMDIAYPSKDRSEIIIKSEKGTEYVPFRKPFCYKWLDGKPVKLQVNCSILENLAHKMLNMDNKTVEGVENMLELAFNMEKQPTPFHVWSDVVIAKEEPSRAFMHEAVKEYRALNMIKSSKESRGFKYNYLTIVFGKDVVNEIRLQERAKKGAERAGVSHEAYYLDMRAKDATEEEKHLMPFFEQSWKEAEGSVVFEKKYSMVNGIFAVDIWNSVDKMYATEEEVVFAWDTIDIPLEKVSASLYNELSPFAQDILERHFSRVEEDEEYVFVPKEASRVYSGRFTKLDKSTIQGLSFCSNHHEQVDQEGGICDVYANALVIPEQDSIDFEHELAQAAEDTSYDIYDHINC